MTKQKDASPFDEGLSYRDLLGVDPSQVRKKVRRGAASTADGELLTSTDLFGDIIEGFDGDEDDPSTADGVSSASARAKEPESSTAELDAVAADTDTDPYATVDGKPPEPTILEAAYSTLLNDSGLRDDVTQVGMALEDAATDSNDVESADYGSYMLLERVASGGMAEVFRAKRKGVEGFEKVVAVKRILPHLSINAEFVEMFIEEAKIVASLTHPNIAQIFDLGKIEDTYYIAMEFVQGHDLRAILSQARKTERQMGVDLAALIAKRVCSALEYAHRHRDASGNELRIVHRDVSPQNILVSTEGEVKLVDFGIARAATKASHTDSGSLRGKLLYMSPEQAWGKALDNRSDIFSLGSVLYEALTGRPLFSGASDMGILERVREASFSPPSGSNPSVPIELDAVVTRALQRDPAHRYQDAGEMLLDLETYLRRRPAVGSSTLSTFVDRLFDSKPEG